jgi:hypothetical protein
MQIKAVNKFTGEVFELPVNNLTEVFEAWRQAQELTRIAKQLQDQAKKYLPKYIENSGMSERVSGYAFRHSVIQRQTYDKSMLRQVFDEDVMDLMLVPDKKFIDNYIKENLMELPPEVGDLRRNMVNVGQPYEVYKLEKVGQ